jgi:Tetratricopeptide repeat
MCIVRSANGAGGALVTWKTEIQLMKKKHLCLSLLVCCLVAGFALAQTAPTVTPTMRAEANRFFQQKDWANAELAYREITQREPANAGAWNRLGQALHAQRKSEPAVAAYQRALAIAQQPAVMYNVAAAHARLKQNEQSLEWLAQAAQAGFDQRDHLQTDEDFAALRQDARFIAAAARIERNAKPCSAKPEARQFDFWLGEWNVQLPNGQPAGTNRVELLLGDCVLMENWTGNGGLQGKSFNFFHAGLGKWHQTWVDSKGGALFFSGEFKDGAMRLSGENVGADGKKAWQRMTFTPLAANKVRQLWEQSEDGGKTWTTVFDGLYLKK